MQQILAMTDLSMTSHPMPCIKQRRCEVLLHSLPPVCDLLARRPWTPPAVTVAGVVTGCYCVTRFGYGAAAANELKADLEEAQLLILPMSGLPAAR